MSVEQDILLDVLELLLTFGFALRIGWLVFVALRSGVARGTRGREFPRSTKPGIFWTIVGFQLGFVVLFLAVSARCLVRLL